MRADRLLAIMMLLQSRGRMTARALVGEFEVLAPRALRDTVADDGRQIATRYA